MGAARLLPPPWLDPDARFSRKLEIVFARWQWPRILPSGIFPRLRDAYPKTPMKERKGRMIDCLNENFALLDVL